MDNLRLSSNVLEQMILAYCQMNVGFFLKIKPYLYTKNSKKKSYFNDEKNQYIFNILCRFFDKHEKFPGQKTLHSIIERIEDKELAFLLDSIIDKIYEISAEEIDPEFIEFETKEFIKEAKSYEAILLGQADIQDRNFAKMASRVEEATRINFDVDLGLSIREVDESLERINRIDKESKIETGFPKLDEMMDGGLHPKEITVFAAIPGGYKTGFLGNIAINCFLQGKNILVYTFETSTERLMMRYFQNIASMSKQEIILDEESMQKKVGKAAGLTTGDLIIKEYNSNMVCSNDLMAHISDLWRYKKWKPDLVVADYILLMRTNDRTLSSNDSYKYYKTVTEELRNIGKSLYVPILSACQINREGMAERGGSKALVTSKYVSESRGILDTADVFLALSQTVPDKKKERLFLYFDKNRSERTGIRIAYEINYEHHKLKEEGIVS